MTWEEIDAACKKAWETPMDPAHFDRELARTLADPEEMEQMREGIRWFMRRYATPRERLAYARKRYADCVRFVRRIRDNNPMSLLWR